MKQLGFMSLVFVTLLAMASCNKSNVSVDMVAAQATADSLINVQAKTIEDSMVAACQVRLTTEVAAKADSMFKQLSAPADGAAEAAPAGK